MCVSISNCVSTHTLVTDTRVDSAVSLFQAYNSLPHLTIIKTLFWVNTVLGFSSTIH